MKKALVNKIKKQLEDQKNEIISIISKPKNSIYTEIDNHGDSVDLIQGEILIIANEQLIARNKEKLVKIDAALKKIEKGEFGSCDECGMDISEKRLLFNPAFYLCISCAEAIEIQGKKRLL
jgi:DnaK suppressor protein